MTHKTLNPFPTTGLVRKPQVLAFLNIGNTKLHNDIRAGKFPGPVKLGKVSAWRAEDVRAIAGYNAEVSA